ncbi:hypothetical protein B0A48_00052 [Cryoendolithus antarcticus]|uniref:LITAF domain-containing protein n=1 Tax=Cryoendolithus antarcticus TaxID=1507870 RepID=A0A1V8TTM6_9PEZI|nr:hypothetical protein B0A48_00052 [Cryoendolithus antarcticus]
MATNSASPAYAAQTDHIAPPYPQPTVQMPENSSSEKPGLDFVQHEPSMAYEPPKPVQERGPVMVVPLEQVRNSPARVDCPYCKKPVMTEIQTPSSGDDGMTQCLICLVCWPLLFCYESDKDLNHHCSVCRRILTHQGSKGGPVQVMAKPQADQGLVASQYAQAT